MATVPKAFSLVKLWRPSFVYLDFVIGDELGHVKVGLIFSALFGFFLPSNVSSPARHGEHRAPTSDNAKRGRKFILRSLGLHSDTLSAHHVRIIHPGGVFCVRISRTPSKGEQEEREERGRETARDKNTEMRD